MPYPIVIIPINHKAPSLYILIRTVFFCYVMNIARPTAIYILYMYMRRAHKSRQGQCIEKAPFQHRAIHSGALHRRHHCKKDLKQRVILNTRGKTALYLLDPHDGVVKLGVYGLQVLEGGLLVEHALVEG